MRKIFLDREYYQIFPLFISASVTIGVEYFYLLINKNGSNTFHQLMSPENVRDTKDTFDKLENSA